MTNHTASFFSASLGNDFDVSDLLEALQSVRDVRKARGRVFKLAFVLAVSLIAVLAGASNFREIGDHVADLSDSLLSKLGASGRFVGSWVILMPTSWIGYPARGCERMLMSMSTGW